MAFAQAPQGIPYQSIVRNASGQPLANQNVRLRFTIHDSAANGKSCTKKVTPLPQHPEACLP